MVEIIHAIGTQDTENGEIRMEIALPHSMALGILTAYELPEGVAEEDTINDPLQLKLQKPSGKEVIVSLDDIFVTDKDFRKLLRSAFVELL